MSNQTDPEVLAEQVRDCDNVTDVAVSEPIEGYQEAVGTEYDELRITATDNGGVELFDCLECAGWFVTNVNGFKPRDSARAKVMVLARTEPAADTLAADRIA